MPHQQAPLKTTLGVLLCPRSALTSSAKPLFARGWIQLPHPRKHQRKLGIRFIDRLRTVASYWNRMRGFFLKAFLSIWAEWSRLQISSMMVLCQGAIEVRGFRLITGHVAGRVHKYQARLVRRRIAVSINRAIPIQTQNTVALLTGLNLETLNTA